MSGSRAIAIAVFCVLPAFAQPVSEPLVVIVDASAAMNHSVGGAPRMDGVRKALLEVVDEFPGNVSLGLMVFGHRSANDCGDFEIVEHIQSAVKDRRERLTRRLATLSAQGRCSVSRALLESLRIFQGRAGRILLIAGGADNCGGNPCVIAETLRQSPVPVRADVVAVGVGANQAASLSCVSGRLSGQFVAVSDAESARKAIVSAALSGLQGGRLRVRVSEAGKPRPAAPYVTVRQLGRPIAQLADNPSVFQLPAGDYEVSARLGPHSESPLAGVRIRPGQTVDQALSIASGVLIVSLTRTQGKPITPMPAVELIQGEDFVASARSLPARFETGAGTYALRVTLNSRQQYVARGLVVEPARTLQRTVEVPAGQVRILVSGNRYQGALRPFVEVLQAGRFVASYSGSPAHFQLLAGDYTARVREAGRAIVSKEFQVKAGQDPTIELRAP
jgi:hypothetical protein